MRKANVFRHESAVPRMSWSPRNLYNLIARSTSPLLSAQTSFSKSSLTMFQQRWRSKRLLRGYHGDWIPERRFKRWFLPSFLPSYAPDHLTPYQRRAIGVPDLGRALDTPVPPVMNLFVRDVERRLDVAVFRACFAHSAYQGRHLVLHGKVSVNGRPVCCGGAPSAHRQVVDPGRLLNVGDLISVEPESVTALNKHVAKRVASDRARLFPQRVKGVPPEPPAGSSAADGTYEAAGGFGGADGAGGVGQADGADGAAMAPGASPQEGPAAADATARDAGSADEDASAPGRGPSHVASERGTEGPSLPAGVLPFNLPPFAAPFLFIPPYLEVSFSTCSAIYTRHPTISTQLVRNKSDDRSQPRASRVYRSDIPSPYPAGGEMFSMAWELYARHAPRVRADERRTKYLARSGASGFDAARAWEQDRSRVATRRGWGRKRKVRLLPPESAGPVPARAAK
ncbi:hypothetical protein MSPP1_002912 [Malassezia sp. CBS 17886]|nr:hypothetical protein MSPP1_002912 [Malassezia sp. CBS 17886]